MYWQDSIRKDGRSHGRGESSLTLLSKVTKIESIRLYVEGFGWVDSNGYHDPPLNEEIFLQLAKNGNVHILVDWLPRSYNY